MGLPDLQGPYDEFLVRIGQIEIILSLFEQDSNSGSVEAQGGLRTTNTITAMSLVFLASSFEEFVREEVGQCAQYLSERYVTRPIEERHRIRNLYWASASESVRLNKSILTRATPKVPDNATITQLRSLVTSIQKFVVNDDATGLEPSVFVRHAHNFRPSVVDELGNRLGINGLIDEVAGSPDIRSHLGAARRTSPSELRSKLDKFYDQRNEAVHSLNASTGYAIPIIRDYLDLFKLTAASIKNVLARKTSAW